MSPPRTFVCVVCAADRRRSVSFVSPLSRACVWCAVPVDLLCTGCFPYLVFVGNLSRQQARGLPPILNKRLRRKHPVCSSSAAAFFWYESFSTSLLAFSCFFFFRVCAPLVRTAAGKQHAVPERCHVRRPPAGLYQAGGAEGWAPLRDRQPSLSHHEPGVCACPSCSFSATFPTTSRARCACVPFWKLFFSPEAPIR